MKLYKSAPLYKRASQPSPTVTRQEIDMKVKELTKFIERDPAKAADVFKQWLTQPAKTYRFKKSA